MGDKVVKATPITLVGETFVKVEGSLQNFIFTTDDDRRFRFASHPKGNARLEWQEEGMEFAAIFNECIDQVQCDVYDCEVPPDIKTDTNIEFDAAKQTKPWTWTVYTLTTSNKRTRFWIFGNGDGNKETRSMVIDELVDEEAVKAKKAEAAKAAEASKQSA